MAKILTIHSSARRDGSFSRKLTDELVGVLKGRHNVTDVIERDVAPGLSFPSESWLTDRVLATTDRNDKQAALLAQTDTLIEELQAADIIVIGAPIYNFSIPASLKAWIDHVSQPGRTFSYTENGPEGLLKNKKAYVVVTSGGVPAGSPTDFVTPYLKHVLGFLGIVDVEFISADRLVVAEDESMIRARQTIERIAA